MDSGIPVLVCCTIILKMWLDSVDCFQAVEQLSSASSTSKIKLSALLVTAFIRLQLLLVVGVLKQIVTSHKMSMSKAISS